jgi:hypothetical protein
VSVTAGFGNAGGAATVSALRISVIAGLFVLCVDDSVSADRLQASRPAGIGLGVAVLGSVVALFVTVNDPVAAACFAAIRATGVGGHVGVFVSVVAFFFAFADSVAADCSGVVVIVVLVGVLPAVVVAAGGQKQRGKAR